MLFLLQFQRQPQRERTVEDDEGWSEPTAEDFEFDQRFVIAPLVPLHTPVVV